MTDRSPPFSIEQIGTNAVRFPSGVPIPTSTDAAVDPYFKTRIPKEVQVEGVMFWPQEKGLFPALVLLPNLYGRQGGMVTANAEVADTLVTRIKEPDVLQDINSCCEFLNTRDQG